MSYTAEGFFRIGFSFRDIGLESKDLRALNSNLEDGRLWSPALGTKGFETWRAKEKTEGFLIFALVAE